MSHDPLSDLYRSREANFKNNVARLQRKINQVSTGRVLVALAVAGVAYLALQSPIYAVPLGVLIVIFVALMQWHDRLFRQRELSTSFAEINHAEWKARRGDCSHLLAGNEFIRNDHPYASDLDIFGEGSLFQYLNRAHTLVGRQALADALLTLPESTEVVEERQQAVQELSKKLEFRQWLQATARLTHDTQSDKDQLDEWLKKRPLLSSGIFRYVLAVLPTVTVLSLASSFFIDQVIPLTILLILSQWVLVGIYSRRIGAFHEYVSRKRNVLKRYAELLTIINRETFSTQVLRDFSTTTHQAAERLRQLASLVRALDARLNFMTNLIVNSLLLYDFQCVYRLERWRDTSGKDFQRWLEALGQLETLSSFGTHAFNHPDFCYAELKQERVIGATGLAHPLIREDECVSNDFSLGDPQTVQLITGANMAGKSTFLRTLGVNVVLALNGGKVCAQRFSCPVMHLRTGMRSADSLKDHQSYFYAELNRLSSIVEELKQNRPMIILLDEILRGTNSNDKQAGSIALVKQLIKYPCLVVIATHDLAMGELENQYPEQVINFHFEPTLDNDQLSFDYLLKRGIAEKMNATFLMKKMGIIPS